MRFMFNSLRRRPDGRDAAPTPRRISRNIHVGNPWHAVSIVPAATCCQSAQDASGRRFLSSEKPPKLPLADCSRETCACSYRHHADRRMAKRATLSAVDTATLTRRRVDDTLNAFIRR